MKKILEENLKYYLEESFRFGEISDEERVRIFKVFQTSYQKATNNSWGLDKFNRRADNWLFFGDMNGFVAVRPQNSGLYKLVGIAGSPKSIINGLNELKGKNLPLWGMVSEEMLSMVLRVGFKTPSKILVKMLYKFIPNSVFGGADFKINSDGSITLKYEDVGSSKKYFIANDNYYNFLKEKILPSISSEIPKSLIKKVTTMLNEDSLSEARREPDKNVKEPLYQQINSFIQKYKNQEDLIFISFRDKETVTLINPRNIFDTPTGIYTYPWNNYYKEIYADRIDNVVNPNFETTVPFAGNREFMFLYKLKSFRGILTSNSSLEEIKPYALAIKNIFPDNERVNTFISDYQKYIENFAKKNRYYRSNLPDVKNFFILLYDVLNDEYGYEKNMKYMVSSLARRIGLNGIIDYGTGLIHPNEKFQALFFRGLDIMEEVKVVRLRESHKVIKNNLDKVSFKSFYNLILSTRSQKERDIIIEYIINNRLEELDFDTFDLMLDHHSKKKENGLTILKKMISIGNININYLIRFLEIFDVDTLTKYLPDLGERLKERNAQEYYIHIVTNYPDKTYLIEKFPFLIESLSNDRLNYLFRGLLYDRDNINIVFKIIDSLKGDLSIESIRAIKRGNMDDEKILEYIFRIKKKYSNEVYSNEISEIGSHYNLKKYLKDILDINGYFKTDVASTIFNIFPTDVEVFDLILNNVRQYDNVLLRNYLYSLNSLKGNISIQLRRHLYKMLINMGSNINLRNISMLLSLNDNLVKKFLLKTFNEEVIQDALERYN